MPGVQLARILGDNGVRREARGQQRPQCGIDCQNEASVLSMAQLAEVTIQRRAGRNEHQRNILEAPEQAAYIRVALKLKIADHVPEASLTVLEVRQQVGRTVSKLCLELTLDGLQQHPVPLDSGWPFHPQELIGFLPGAEVPVVEKTTDLLPNDEPKSWIFEHRAVRGFDLEEFEQLLVGLEHNHARVGPDALAQNVCRVSQTPAEMKNNVGFFQVHRPIEPIHFAQRVVRAVIPDAIDLDRLWAGSGRCKSESLDSHKGILMKSATAGD